MIVEVEGEVFSDGDLLKLHGCDLNDEDTASEIIKASGCRVLGTLVNSQRVDIESIATSLPKQSTPPIFRISGGA